MVYVSPSGNEKPLVAAAKTILPSQGAEVLPTIASALFRVEMDPSL
jgi:hypothetical protein